MATDTTTPGTELSAVEQEYVEAVAAFLNADHAVREAEDQLRKVTNALRHGDGGEDGDLLAQVTREQTLTRAGVEQSVGEDSDEGKRALKAAETMVRVEEAVVSGVDRGAAMFAVMLGADPREAGKGDVSSPRPSGLGGSFEF